MNAIKTSIVIPAYNERDSIEKTIKGLAIYLSQACEIIVVNDGSTDGTSELLKKISDIKVINHPKNLGYGAALKSGIRQAQGEYILIIDADGTYPTESIAQLISDEDNWHMVVGARTSPQSQIPLLRRPAKWLLGRLANYLTKTKIPDLNSGLRIIKKDALEKFWHLLPDGFSFTTTITLALLTSGYPVKYVPINYYKRKGKSKIRPVRDTLNFLQLIIKAALYFDPLKVFIPISLVLFLLSVATLILSYLFAPKIMDVTIALFFISGIQTLTIGMMADLIVKHNKKWLP